MITLSELLHTIGEEKESGLIPVDDWRWPDVDHLANMGFTFDSDFYMKTDKDPSMTVYKKKEKDPKTGKETQFFFLQEEGSLSEEKKSLKRFQNFNDLIDFFDTYQQPEIDKNM